jgi:hypothetical protein
LSRVLIAISILLSLCTCRKDEYDTSYRPIDKQYFNFKVGAYFIYNVDEIKFDDFTNTSDTLHYQLRELNESVFKDNLGRDAIRVDRHTRSSDTSVWKYLNTWYAVQDPEMVERVEENKRFIKLSFPISNDAVWNANSLNTDNANNVFYGWMHQRYKLDTFVFDSAINVKSTPRTTSTSERAFEEVYAKHVGLVYKYQVQVDKAGTLFRGYKLKYRLYQYGF